MKPFWKQNQCVVLFGDAGDMTMATISVLSDGTRISKLKDDAKALWKAEGISHAEALNRIADKRGYANWEALSGAAWTLDEEGTIKSPASCRLPGEDFVVDTTSLLMPVWQEWESIDDVPETISAYVEMDFEEGCPVMAAAFFNAGMGINFEIDGPTRNQIRKAIESGSVSDHVAAQGKLIENTLDWFPEEAMMGQTHLNVCILERFKYGISESAVAWEAPDGVSFGTDQHQIRVFRMNDGRFLVCHEAETESGQTVVGIITRAQFDAVPHNPYDYREMMKGFANAAGLSFMGSESGMDPDFDRDW